MLRCIDIPDGSDGEAISLFTACGINLDSTPYHYPSSYSYSSGCSQNLYLSSTTQANRIRYARYPSHDISYTSCGRDCRGGDYVLGYGYASGCNLDTSSTSTAYNSVSCKQVVNSSASVCGIVSCPSSRHYVSKYESKTSCSIDGQASSEPNQTTCIVPTSTTTSLYACGDTCPDGFSIQSFRYSEGCRPSSAASTSENNQVHCVKSI
ncbi:hypothetical protein [Sorangium sp. So ce131]|uniref:hypothetical protein n=1 Tax=Sorangium sp. So ce131 TaxID=3133282 RepID=UPI003F5F7146